MHGFNVVLRDSDYNRLVNFLNILKRMLIRGCLLWFLFHYHNNNDYLFSPPKQQMWLPIIRTRDSCIKCTIIYRICFSFFERGKTGEKTLGAQVPGEKTLGAQDRSSARILTSMKCYTPDLALPKFSVVKASRR